MAVTVLGFDGGTAGVTVAADATSGFGAVLIDGGQTMVYTSTVGEVLNGARGIKIAAVATSAHAYGQVTGLATTQCAFDCLFEWPVVSTADFHQMRLFTSAGVAVATVLMNSLGKIRLLGNGGVSLLTFTATTPTTVPVRLKGWVKPGTSSTTGSAIVEMWDVSTGLQVGTTMSTTAADFGTALIDWVRFGNSGGYSSTYFMDLAAYDPAATGLMPDQGGNLPPVVSAIVGNQTVAAAATTSLTSTASDPDGTITYLWTHDYPVSGGPAFVTATAANTTLTAPAAGSLLVERMTVTDNLGATASATTEVRVPLTTEINPITGYGGIGVTVTKVGSSTNEETTLGTGTIGSPDDTKYLEFPAATGTAQARRWRLEPMVPMTSGTFTHRLALSAAGTVAVNARLYQGSTIKATWALATVTTSFVDQTSTLTATQAGTITDWGNLWIQYEEV